MTVSPDEDDMEMPENTVYVGGEDGGSFLAVDETNVTGTYRVRVFDDQDAELTFDEQCVLLPADSPILDLADPELYCGFDGDVVLLADGRLMCPPHLALYYRQMFEEDI